ncbi:MAG: bile acid:sodium symporter family protein [Gammaproteobacteria bacterium]|nr:bile acid:sodium symporter family protein [Gammaproteobacteria bacterium]
MTLNVLLPLSLAFIMFSMGLSLVTDDFKRVFTHPLAMGFGLLSQMVILPLIAFSLVVLFSLEPNLAVGVIILAACPGGITSNLLTHIAGGDSALSVSLTAVTSLAGVITIPLLVNFGMAWYAGSTETLALPLGAMISGVFMISTLPLVMGMLLRHLRRAWAVRIEPAARKAAAFLFILIVVATFMGQWGNIGDFFSEAGPSVIALNLATIASALAGAKLLGLERRQAIAIGLECGLQNAAMGIFVAGTLLANSTMVIPSVLYALVMNISAAAFILGNREPASGFLFSR